ncbi:endonuclease YncB(thermonuclease family) [Rhizobium leguminosarum]
MIAGLIICASLTVVDGDTIKCDGQNMRLLGEGVPFVSGIDTPEIGSHAKCIKERKLALIAKGGLKELLAEKGLRVIFTGAVDKTPTHRPLVNIKSCSSPPNSHAGSKAEVFRTVPAAV